MVVYKDLQVAWVSWMKMKGVNTNANHYAEWICIVLRNRLLIVRVGRKMEYNGVYQ